MALAKEKPIHRNKARNREKKQPQTMHDKDYRRVFHGVDQVRASMKPGQIYADFRCPICGGYTAYVLRPEQNNGRTCVGSCTQGCFELWE